MTSAARAAGQAVRLPEIISQIVKEVRGYVGGCAANTLGDGDTIPDELLGAAISRIRFDLATALPVSSLLTEDRRTANTNAIRLLENVASCDFKIIPPATAAADQPAGGNSVVVVTKTPRRARRDQLGGL